MGSRKRSISSIPSQRSGSGVAPSTAKNVGPRSHQLRPPSRAIREGPDVWSAALRREPSLRFLLLHPCPRFVSGIPNADEMKPRAAPVGNVRIWSWLIHHAPSPSDLSAQ
eukprot:scaffold948_cov29-Tisochrysis_lutea.AAC.3